MYVGESYYLNWWGADQAFFAQLAKEGREERGSDLTGSILRDIVPYDDDDYETMGCMPERNEIYAKRFMERFPSGLCTPHEAFDFFKSIIDEFLTDEPQSYIDAFKKTLNSVTYEEWRDMAMVKVPWMFEDESLD